MHLNPNSNDIAPWQNVECFIRIFAVLLFLFLCSFVVLCIKGVVFFAFWQGILLEILEYFEIVHADRWYTEGEVAEAIQNLLICMEMGLLFAPIHSYAFPYAPYGEDASKKKEE